MLPIRKKHWPEILLHLIFWVGIFFVEGSLTSLSERLRLNFNGEIVEKIIVRSTFPVSLITMALLVLLFYVNIFWLFKKVLLYRNGFIRAVIVIGWAGIIFFTNYFTVGALLKFTRIDLSSWRQLQPQVLLIFLFTLGLSAAYFFSKEWLRNELLRKQLEAHQLRTELKFLKSQINPHFLFNTLNNLFSMAQDKCNDELADGISKLSEMMRYMIYESNAEIVPLKKEIEYLKNSIVLNKLRYAEREVVVVFDYPERGQDILIAPMIFIPFVENAFKHGVLINESSEIQIAISVLDKKQIAFSCENKNYSFIKKMEDDSGGIGLENVKRRLELVYPNKYELTVNNNSDRYAVLLKINVE